MKIEYYQKKICRDLFVSKYTNVPKFQPLCKECPYYDKNYSCTPSMLDIMNLYTKYKKASLFLMKVTLDKNEEIDDYEEQYINPEKDKFINMLYKEEAKHPRATFINPGPCRLCKVCKKEENKACIHRDKLRYSASAVGVDATNICKDFFDIEIKWAENGKFPPYFCFLAVLLYN